MRTGLFLILIFACWCADVAHAETVYFLVAETNSVHGDSYVLPLTEPTDIAHARALIDLGPPAGQPIAVARIAKGMDCIDRDYYHYGKRLWSWHVEEFVNFADATIEILDGWPGLVQSDIDGWIANTGGYIGFWTYTVVAELGENPEHWWHDYNSDGDVNFLDYAYLAEFWLDPWDYNYLEAFSDAWLSPFASQPQPEPFYWFDCWNCVFQCYGDADCAKEGISGYRVYSNDLTIIMAVYKSKECGWPCYYPNFGYNPCADFDRDLDVDDNDWAILEAHLMWKDSDFPGFCCFEEMVWLP